MNYPSQPETHTTAGDGRQSPIRHRFVRERSLLGFASVGALMLFVTGSGLAIWLLPFGTTAQIAVLAHTALGILLVLPYAAWQLSHWLATRTVKRSPRKWSAYLATWAIILTALSGLYLTAQGIFGLRISYLADRLHLYAGLVLIPLVAYHAWPRRLPAAVAVDGRALAIRRERQRLWAIAALGCAAGLAVVVVAGRVMRPQSYLRSWPASYKLVYGVNPFAPSLARTVDGRPVADELLASSQTCGTSGCHRQIYREWQASAHRWASEDKFFQVVQSVMIHQEGAPATRYCGGCHDPVSLLAGYKDASTGISAPGFRQGDACVICHSTRRVDVQGNANYVFGAPQPYLFELSGTPARQAVAHFLIRTYPRQHDTDYDLTLAKRPESCAACHKQFIDKNINHLGWVQLQNQYDDWKHGKWNASSDPAHNLRCQQCHMFYSAAPDMADADPADLQLGLGLQHRNHFFAAGNQIMPEEVHTPEADLQTKLVTQWLTGRRNIPEIQNIWPKGPIVPLHLLAPPSVVAGQQLKVSAVLTNNKVGHSFPTGPLDLIRVWVEITARDGAGHVVFHSGQLLPNHHIEPGAFILKAVGVDAEGKEIVRHDLWHLVGAKFKRAIFPGYSDMYQYSFAVPRGTVGPIQISARLRYRKANQYFMDVVFPGQNRTAPVTDLSSDRALVAVAPGTSRAGTKSIALVRPARRAATSAWPAKHETSSAAGR
jgi:hypothetical protein